VKREGTNDFEVLLPANIYICDNSKDVTTVGPLIAVSPNFDYGAIV
jgi:hypothetical protein